MGTAGFGRFIRPMDFEIKSVQAATFLLNLREIFQNQV
jgi:hypothetical protein